MSFNILILAALTLQMPEWETTIGFPPTGNLLIAANASGSMDIFIPMGDHGLGGWTGSGNLLNGFPVSGDNTGVSRKPAAFYASATGNVVVFSDTDGYIHMVDHNGIEQPGWPVSAGAAVSTGISVVDLDEDSYPEISFGTVDSKVHLIDIFGSPVAGWPVELPAELQWQPSQLSLGGNSDFGLVCALVSTRVYVLARNGSIQPGWPINTGYTTSTIPVTADIDSDGLGDVIFAAHNDRLYVVSGAGSGVNGWPFFLDDRTATGAVAIGLLDSDPRNLQLAVSCQDRSVMLINADGSIAGSWRWPNVTDGLPSSPIIAGTGPSAAVIVGSDDGFVYAWDAEGRSVDGFPIDFGQPISTSPAIGDIDGDGRQELVVLGRSGRLSAYSVTGFGGAVDSWPQMLCDESNSGRYGVSCMPVAQVGSVMAEYSGDVSLQYDVTGSVASGVSLAYSTNAGYTWITTGNYTDNGTSVTWFSDEDLPGQDVQECALKITPFCPEGPGISGLSTIFHLDNNVAPTLLLISSEEESDGWFTLHYAVEDPESDIIQLQAQYSTDGQQTWDNAHLSGSIFEIPSWFYGEPFLWNAVADIGEEDIENTALRVRAADSDPGPWSVISDFSADAISVSSGQIIAPVGEVSGRITLGLRVSSPENDPLAFQYEFSTDAGESWNRATVTECSVPTVGSCQFEIIWESGVDMPGQDSYLVKFRALPEEGNTAAAIPSSRFHVDNNALPTIEITSPGSWDSFKGSVPVSFRSSDAEGDDLSLILQYRMEGSSSWITAKGLNSIVLHPHSSYLSSETWNSSEDLPGIEPMELRIRLGVIDGDTVFSGEKGPLSINNSRVPSVMQAAENGMSPLDGAVSVSYELSDPENRTIDILVSFSTDGGRTWSEAEVDGDIFGRNSGNYEGEFTWHYRSDLGGSNSQTLLKITPQSGSMLGTPRILELTVR
jgi:hypothetical protein